MFLGRISLCCVFLVLCPGQTTSLFCRVAYSGRPLQKNPVSFQVYISYQLQSSPAGRSFFNDRPTRDIEKSTKNPKLGQLFVCSPLCFLLFVDTYFLTRQNEQTLNGHCTKESASSKVCLVKGASTDSDNAQFALSISSTVYASNPDSFASLQHSWSGCTKRWRRRL